MRLIERSRCSTSSGVSASADAVWLFPMPQTSRGHAVFSSGASLRGSLSGPNPSTAGVARHKTTRLAHRPRTPLMCRAIDRIAAQ